MEAMDIYIANIPFYERYGSKVRPALVIEVGREFVMIFKITSQYQHKSAQIRQLYYSIQNWQEVGLKMSSYVDTHKLYRLNKKLAFSQKPIGKLTALDRLGLFRFIQQQN